MALFSRTPIAPLEYSRTLWMRAWVGLVMLFLYAPLFVLMIFSFNDSKRNVVWRGFTTKYYEKALGNDQLVEALLNSLTIAALATIASLLLGAVAAVMLWRFRFPLKGAVDGTISLPIIVPEICLGVAFLMFFAAVGWPTDLVWPFNLGAITIAHITFCFPFVTMVVRSRLASFNREQEEVADADPVPGRGVDRSRLHGSEDRGLLGVEVAVDDQHPGAFGHELLDDALAEARAAAGDDGHLVLESHVASSRFLKGLRFFQR